MSKESKKIKLYLDFDDTIVNSTKKMVEMLNEHYHTNKNWRKLKQYDGEDLFPQCNQEIIENIFASPYFFANLKIKFGFKFAMSILSKFCEIGIVTLGTSNNLSYKKIWCNNNFDFNFEFIGLKDFKAKKTVVDMSGGIMVDDKTDLLMSTNAKYKILIKGHRNVEWNQLSDNDDAIVRNNWIGILFLILKIIWKERRANN